jgi:hypothetical protein
MGTFFERWDESHVEGPWKRSVLHSSVDSREGYTKFLMRLFFDDGCLYFEGSIKGDGTYQGKEQEFLGLVDIFLKHYLWLGDDPVSPKGFRTRFCVIEKNNDFKVRASFHVSGDGPGMQEANLTFNFYAGTMGIDMGNGLSAFDKLKLHFMDRLVWRDMILGYRWHLSSRQVNFLDSNIAEETLYAGKP